MTALEDAARAYVAAWVANREAEPKDWTAARVHLDAAWHDLAVASDFPCEMCETGTCPGPVLAR